MHRKASVRLALVVSLCLWATCALSQKITAYGTVWPPYIEPKLTGQGLAVSIVTTALKRAGYSPSYIFQNWDRVLESSANDQQSHIIMAIWKNSERNEHYLFSEPYINNEIVFIKQKKDEHITYESMRDLAHLKIGVVYDYAYSDDFDQDEDLHKVPETHVLANLLQLISGNIDLTVGDERTLHYEISRHLSAHKVQLEFIPKPLSVRSLHIAVPKHHPEAQEIVDKFNHALKEMLEDGTYKKILRQSNEEIWKKSYLSD